MVSPESPGCSYSRACHRIGQTDFAGRRRTESESNPLFRLLVHPQSSRPAFLYRRDTVSSRALLARAGRRAQELPVVGVLLVTQGSLVSFWSAQIIPIAAQQFWSRRKACMRTPGRARLSCGLVVLRPSPALRPRTISGPSRTGG
jgi:hypothetical protein